MATVSALSCTKRGKVMDKIFCGWLVLSSALLACHGQFLSCIAPAPSEDAGIMI